MIARNSFVSFAQLFDKNDFAETACGNEVGPIHKVDVMCSHIAYRPTKIVSNPIDIGYKTLNTSVPQYLSQRINRRVKARTLRSSAIRHCSSNRTLVPTSRNVLFDVPRRLSGTHYPRLSSEATHCLYSNLG